MLDSVDNTYDMETVICSNEPSNISSLQVQRAGERLKLNPKTIKEIIQPQNIQVFRLPAYIMGKVINFWGCMVLHNNARGEYKGGIRISSEVNIWETTELARLMTLKTAVAGIEFGGGKTGIKVDFDKIYGLFDKTERDLEFEGAVKQGILREYSLKFRDLFKNHVYIPAPDMGTGPQEMIQIYNVTMDPATVTGKPEGIQGWLPGRREATGYGISIATLRLMEMLNIKQKGAKVAIQGFGNVGSHTAKYLAEAGAKIVGITDIYGSVYDENGINIEALMIYARKHGTIRGFNGSSLTNEELFAMDVDILIPAAVGHAINEKTAPLVRAKGVVSAANMPITPEGMDILEQKGIMVLPDILANAGGVIASMIEYSSSLSARQRNIEWVLSYVGEKMEAGFEDTLDIAKSEKISLTEASIQLAVMRVHKGMKERGWLTSV